MKSTVKLLLWKYFMKNINQKTRQKATNVVFIIACANIDFE